MKKIKCRKVKYKIIYREIESEKTAKEIIDEIVQDTINKVLAKHGAIIYNKKE